MDGDKAVIYDPNPLDLELEIFGNLSENNMDMTDLAKPEAVRFLVHNQRIALSKLKIAEKNLTILQQKNNDLIANREDLRIKLATHQEWGKVTFLEIPISILSGFSINMLTNRINDGIGWILLILSILMLIFLRAVNLKNKSSNNFNEAKPNV